MTERIKLGPEASQVFTDATLNPPEPNKALKAAVRWQTCPNCAEVVKIDGVLDDKYHVCPPEPLLSVAQHVQYKRVPVFTPPGENDV